MYLFKFNYTRADSIYLRMTASNETVVRSGGRLCLAVNQAYRGKMDRALQLLDEGIATDLLEQADDVEIALKQLTKALIYEEKKQLALAILAAQKAISYSDSTHPQPRLIIGPLLYIRLLAASGNLQEAKTYLKTWRETMQDNNRADSPWYWCASGCIAFYEGDLETSIQHLSTAADSILLLPDGSWVYDLTHLMLARVYLESAKLDAAVSEYENLLSNYSWGRSGITWGATYFPIWGVKIHYYLGQAYEQLGRHDQAIERYETFLNIWKDADPGLTIVDDTKARLARLKSRS